MSGSNPVRIEQREAQVEEALLRARTDQDLLALVAEMIVAREFGADGILQFGRAADIGVAGVSLADGGDTRLGDVRGRIEIGLARRQTDDVASSRTQRRCASSGGHRGRGFDAFYAPGD